MLKGEREQGEIRVDKVTRAAWHGLPHSVFILSSLANFVLSRPRIFEFLETEGFRLLTPLTKEESLDSISFHSLQGRGLEQKDLSGPPTQTKDTHIQFQPVPDSHDDSGILLEAR